ncbi:DMT family transporter [Vibrio sp. SM6]|uniref:DMT family transporter n=1 Tax=Vibrio agarilyticus TaxID=2726741 RepID=A0A7X8TP77_9VIBR|nr:DMT family transporter [Vibrio agarilyticus]
MNAEHKSAWILFFTTILAALGWVFSKESIQGLPPFGFIGLRFIVAAFCLLPLCLGALRKAKRQDIAAAALTGLLLCSAILCWIYAISISDTLGEGAFILSLSMLIAPLIAWGIFREKPKRAFWTSLPIAVFGLALLSLNGGWQQSSSQWWFVISATLMALHFVVNSRFSQRLPVLLLTTIQLFVAGCIASAVSLITETQPTSVTHDIWIWFGLSAILATAIRYAMFTTGLKYSTPANAALIMLLEPVWTVLLSITWYGETISPLKAVGCVLILFSLLVYRTNGKLLRIRRRVINP